MLAEKYAQHISKTDDCWVWSGKAANGYGRAYADKRWVQAHRLVYEALVGPIGAGLELDHLCRNTLCVRPDHLEPVTHRENVLRGNGLAAGYAKRTHCANGHPFEAGNIAIVGRKLIRWCAVCRRDSSVIRTRRYRAKQRGLAR